MNTRDRRLLRFHLVTLPRLLAPPWWVVLIGLAATIPPGVLGWPFWVRLALLVGWIALALLATSLATGRRLRALGR